MFKLAIKEAPKLVISTASINTTATINLSNAMDPDIFPEEIWMKILTYCTVPDILSVGCTCTSLRKAANIEYLWKRKWIELQSRCNFTFPEKEIFQRQALCYKDICVRLYQILYTGEEVMFQRCSFCEQYSCHRYCMEHSSSKVVMDIGNKFTWVIAPSFGIRRHFTMFGMPKQCSKVKNAPSVREQAEDTKMRRATEPFCVFCNTVKLYREKKRVNMEGEVSWPSTDSKLLNGFCVDTVAALGIPNMDIVSPASALLDVSQFHIVRGFVDHLFHQMGLLQVLQKPNTVLLFCEPLAMDHSVRVQLLHYLFLKTKVARVCLVSKPVAVGALAELDTCVVVDSGALSTSVSVVLDGKVADGRWRQIPVGGWHVSEYLKMALQWQPEENNQIPVSYLDVLSVKEKCRLSSNFAMEERRKSPARREHINLRVDSYADYKKRWKVSLGAELYLAPEIMYSSLDLPKVIRDVTQGLPTAVLKECFTHIFLTGGNTDLMGFKARIERDLREMLPDLGPVLRVRTLPGSSSWTAAMGSTYLYAPHPGYCSPQKPTRVPGAPFWMSREEYILYGCQGLEGNT